MEREDLQKQNYFDIQFGLKIVFSFRLSRPLCWHGEEDEYGPCSDTGDILRDFNRQPAGKWLVYPPQRYFSMIIEIPLCSQAILLNGNTTSKFLGYEYNNNFPKSIKMFNPLGEPNLFMHYLDIIHIATRLHGFDWPNQRQIYHEWAHKTRARVEPLCWHWSPLSDSSCPCLCGGTICGKIHKPLRTKYGMVVRKNKTKKQKQS